MAENKDLKTNEETDYELRRLEIISKRPQLSNYGILNLFFISIPLGLVPFTKSRRHYKEDIETYEQTRWTKTQRYTQNHMTRNINNLNVVIIAIITSLWTTLPQVLPEIWESTTWNWMTLGANTQIGWSENWMGALGQTGVMFLVPSGGGFIYSKLPRLVPTLKGKFISNVVVKIVPVIILLLSYSLISQILTRTAVKHKELYFGTDKYNVKYEKRALRVWNKL